MEEFKVQKSYIVKSKDGKSSTLISEEESKIMIESGLFSYTNSTQVDMSIIGDIKRCTYKTIIYVDELNIPN